MKRITYFLAVMFCFTAFVPEIKGETDKKEKIELSEKEKARLEEINLRINEIKAMDFSELDKAERKELRKELRDIKNETKALKKGVYLSLGAIIIITILLILLLD
ncbi:hypothetical protein QWY93_07050 [Echinicola jeungdonensis]|uniref:Seryl-tRNA synthetase n=1 Tax=Echinicola jeungdonensis TaxID=709343 RepID=A0ABV5J7G7_9BACT|nr:hypothetical protein [Echinicola jeungdonensis]MDN3669080.1 hypothetical protein [Echinicola jeungdonensis]